MNYFKLYVSGKQIPSGGPHLDTNLEKGSVMAYRTLFEGSGIRHSNAGLQISHASFINGYFMLLFDLMPDQGVSKGHTSHTESGNIRIEARFSKALSLATTCLLYFEYYSCVRIDSSPTVTTDLIIVMDNRQIMCCLWYVRSFLGVFLSDLLPEHPIARSGTLIVNTDPHTDRFTLASHSSAI